MHYPRPRQVVTVVVAILATLSSLPLQAATPIHLSSQRFGGPSTDRGYSVVADAAGNVYVTGYFAGSVDFGGGALVSAGNSADIFVAKFNAAGVHQWSLGFGDFSCLFFARRFMEEGEVLVALAPDQLLGLPTGRVGREEGERLL